MLIEDDLQINMQIHLKSNKREMIEGGNWFSAAKYSPRKYYSIETVMLEKSLIIDSSLIEINPARYNITDLQL